MKVAAKQAFVRARRELADNSRLRLGAWIIVGLLVLFGLLVQADRLTAVHDDYIAGTVKLERAKATLARTDWAQLLGAERETHRELAERFWQADTEGLAQAQLEAALSRIIQDLGFRNVRIRSGLSESAANLPSVWRVQTQLNGEYREGGERRLIHAIATHPKKLVVDQLELRRSNSRVTLVLSAYFIGLDGSRERDSE